GRERRRAARGDGWAHPRPDVPRRAVLPPVALGVGPEGVHDLPADLCPDEMEVLAVDVRVDDDNRDIAVDVDDADIDAPRLGATPTAGARRRRLDHLPGGHLVERLALEGPLGQVGMKR